MTLDGLEINRAAPTPAYLQLKEQLRHAIAHGSLQPGAALPSERNLAVSLGLSRMTVRRAYEELVAEERLEQRQGSGTYVRGKPFEQIIDRVLGFTDEAQGLGLDPGTRLLEVERLKADPEVAAALSLSVDEPVLRVRRLRTADGQPLALQEAYLPPRLLELSLPTLQRLGSLYRTLAEQFGVHPVRARQTVGARLPTGAESAALGIARSVPVLALERTSFDASGAAIEYVRSAYRGDRYRMALNLRGPL